MDFYPLEEQDSVFILSCDEDTTIQDGDTLRLWNSLGIGVAHDVWVGSGGTVYENSGPGGNVRRNTLDSVLAGRKVIQIVARTAATELEAKVRSAESRLGTPWTAFYNCQDFVSEVATGWPRSFQREAAVAASFFGGILWLANQQKSRRRMRRRRR